MGRIPLEGQHAVIARQTVGLPAVFILAHRAGHTVNHIGRGLLFAAGGYLRRAGQIGGILVLVARNVAVVLEQQLLQLLHMRLHIMGRAAVLFAQRGGGAHRLAAHGAGAHHAAGRHGQLACAHAAAADEQVIHILGYIGTIRNGIQAVEGVDFAGHLVKVQQAVLHMVIHRPAAIGHRVVKHAVFQQIVLIEHVLALHAAAFAHAGQHAHPFQIKVLRAVITAVFDMIPHAVHALDQFVADVLIFLDDIGLFAGQFNPPIAVIQAIGVKHHILGGVVHVVQDRIGLVFCLQHAKERLRIGMLAVAQLLLGEGIAALGRHKRHRMAAIHGLE